MPIIQVRLDPYFAAQLAGLAKTRNVSSAQLAAEIVQHHLELGGDLNELSKLHRRLDAATAAATRAADAAEQARGFAEVLSQIANDARQAHGAGKRANAVLDNLISAMNAVGVAVKGPVSSKPAAA